MTAPSRQCARGVVAELHRVAAETGYSVKEDNEGLLLFRDRQITKVRFTPTSDDEAFVYLSVRTTSWHLEGERTDVHDIFSMLLAAFLRRASSNYSVSMWNVAHPAVDIETEIYARLLTLDQPDKSLVRTTPESINTVKNLLIEISFFELLFPRLFEWERGTKQDFSYDDVAAREWAVTLGSILKEHPDDKVQFNRRWGPDWLYYRSIRRHVSLVQSPTAASFAMWLNSDTPATSADRETKGVQSHIYVSPRVRSAVPLRTIAFARRVLRSLHRDQLPPHSVIPLESDVLFASGSYLLLIRKECGLQAFKEELQRVELRHQREAVLLFPAERFEWAKRINDERFELLIRDLLAREPGVHRVRKVGHSRDADRRSDLVVDWLTPPTPGSSVQDEVAPSVLRKVVVQVKASSRSVNKNKVQDIRDTVEDHGANGYFLAVSTQLTSDLTDHLERMRLQGLCWTDWWNRAEIEERLNRHPDIADRYSDIVRRIG